MACDKVIDKAKQIAAHQLEANVDDLEFVGGVVPRGRARPSTSCRSPPSRSAAFTAHNLPDGLEPNLEAQVTYDPPNFSWPFGTHMCLVEVDTETGDVDVLQYVAVDDCGNQVNPMIVEGQVHGGVVQGLAQALYEGAVYDADGNLTHVDARRLPRAGGERRAVDHPRPLGHPVADEPARRQGRRRGRHHRCRTRRHERHRRCAVRPRRPRRRHARQSEHRVERDHVARSNTTSSTSSPNGGPTVIPAAFDYVRAESAEEAISLIGQHGDEAKFIAGGHSLLPMMKLRLAQPSVLIDIGRLRTCPTSATPATTSRSAR